MAKQKKEYTKEIESLSDINLEIENRIYNDYYYELVLHFLGKNHI